MCARRVASQVCHSHCSCTCLRSGELLCLYRTISSLPTHTSFSLGSIRATLVCIHSGECNPYNYPCFLIPPEHTNAIHTHSTMLPLHMGRSVMERHIHLFPSVFMLALRPHTDCVLARFSMYSCFVQSNGRYLLRTTGK